MSTMRVAKLLPIVIVILLLSSTIVQAGFWDSFKKNLGKVIGSTPTGIVDVTDQAPQKNEQPAQVPPPAEAPKPVNTPSPPNLNQLLKDKEKKEEAPVAELPQEVKEQQPITVPPPKQENIPKPDSQKVFREATNTKNTNAVKNNKASPSIAKKSDFFTSYPIILVHGLDGSTESLFRLQYQLAADGIAENKRNIVSTSTTSQLCPDGWPKTISVNFEYYENQVKNLGIKVYADRLAKAIETLKSCTGSAKVNIVAHSMGGLISRTYMVNHGSGSVNRLIMLETPNYGSTIAGAGGKIDKQAMVNRFGSDVLQLLPNSDFLNWLNSADCQNRKKMVNIASKVFFEPASVSDNEAIKQKQKDSCDSSIPFMSIQALAKDAFLANTKNVDVSNCSHSDISSPRDCPKAYENVKTYLR